MARWISFVFVTAAEIGALLFMLTDKWDRAAIFLLWALIIMVSEGWIRDRG